ncbi:Uncharacterised protein [Klebsiella pneumoniae]|uniref:hypothetical protein n=1 Tax=Klebsiella pneumoniae TaxID=573 RepID=UPI000E2A68E6|nr:hypothetical protein [Klebsiella pneumoniae]EKW1254557.1 hypothetical protein [Klebsiella pneumoniae]MBL4415864.1 hypothetical protein [Klebsiella pneumoniae]MBX9237567.1 hypothetical protein [Klebsiella pneumoniae]MDX8140446.1 hypothetical protein [Klebsiella pneumoniae]MEB6020919.1 hypothetical protein [Klebsiella pneumoniae]
MKVINFFSVLFIPLFLTSCSHREPDIISELKLMQIPVIQKDNTQEINQESLNAYYSKNTSDISNLTNFLKSNYVSGSAKKDIFDNQSQVHQAYIALTNLEQAGMVNEQYYIDKNIKGIMALNGALNPIADEIKSR